MKTLLVIFGDIDFENDIATVHKIYGKVYIPENNNEAFESLLDIYGTYVVPEIYGNDNIVYKCDPNEISKPF